MALTVVQLDKETFQRRRVQLVASYAEAIAPARGLTPAEAAAEAERDIAGRLPRGHATRGQLLRGAEVDGAEAGWIWVSLPTRAMPGSAWISDVEVDPPFRGRGYAARLITAVEAELVALGVTRLGLNVFGDNTTAQRLYERLGFEVIAQQRSRTLTAVAAADDVELVPLADHDRRIAALFADHAHDLVLEQGLWHGEAEARAAAQRAELLPHGPRTAGMILRTVLAGGVPVGWVWAARPAPPRPRSGWLHAIGIDEPFRSRGYGRQAIAAIEAELLRTGVTTLGLNVHGHNTGARRLCDRLGYTLLSQQMTKELPGG